MGIYGKEATYSQPTGGYDKKGKLQPVKYPKSYCAHTWSYHYEDKTLKQCIKCKALAREILL